MWPDSGSPPWSPSSAATLPASANVNKQTIANNGATAVRLRLTIGTRPSLGRLDTPTLSHSPRRCQDAPEDLHRLRNAEGPPCAALGLRWSEFGQTLWITMEPPEIACGSAASMSVGAKILLSKTTAPLLAPVIRIRNLSTPPLAVTWPSYAVSVNS